MDGNPPHAHRPSPTRPAGRGRGRRLQPWDCARAEHASPTISAGSGPSCRGTEIVYVTVMRMLITNDDGIYSPGIAALALAAADFGEVRIVAPDVEMSSA